MHRVNHQARSAKPRVYGLTLRSARRRRVVAKLNGFRHMFRKAFALYEVLVGVTIFVVGVLALGRSVENCLQASALSAQEDRVRQILANRMAEIQATPGPPDTAKQSTVQT